MQARFHRVVEGPEARRRGDIHELHLTAHVPELGGEFAVLGASNLAQRARGGLISSDLVANVQGPCSSRAAIGVRQDGRDHTKRDGSETMGTVNGI